MTDPSEYLPGETEEEYRTRISALPNEVLFAEMDATAAQRQGTTAREARLRNYTERRTQTLTQAEIDRRDRERDAENETAADAGTHETDTPSIEPTHAPSTQPTREPTNTNSATGSSALRRNTNANASTNASGTGSPNGSNDEVVNLLMKQLKDSGLLMTKEERMARDLENEITRRKLAEMEAELAKKSVQRLPDGIVVQDNTRPAPQLKLLESLEPDNVISFIHSYDSINNALGPNKPRLQALLYVDGKIIRALESIYGATKEEDVVAALRKIKDNYDLTKSEDAFLILKGSLTWDTSKKRTVEQQLEHFFQDIRRMIGSKIIDKPAMDKDVTKLALKKLPSYFGLDVDDFSNLETLLNAGRRKAIADYDSIPGIENRPRKTKLQTLEEILKLKAWALKDKSKMPDLVNVAALQDNAMPQVMDKPDVTSDSLTFEKFEVFMNSYEARNGNDQSGARNGSN